MASCLDWILTNGHTKRLCTDFVPVKLCEWAACRPQWIDGETKRKLEARKRAYKALMILRTAEAKATYKAIQGECKRIMKSRKVAYEEGLVQKVDTQPNRFNSFLNRKSRATPGIQGFHNTAGVLQTDELCIAELLAEQYPTVCLSPTPDSEDFDIPDRTESGTIIAIEDVENALSRLMPAKAAGPDILNPRVICELASIIAPSTRELHLCTLATATVPDDWKQSLMTPSYKRGDRFLSQNYRPVSLTSVFVKVLENFIWASHNPDDRITRFCQRQIVHH
ncbi:unnamed protein product [Dibothriocephalus latus]|uniref:Reverse transcriptase domain-containing protein n=1 Tax=Dibothriocephalus latus TaxID=60516 RepID=A0A3P7L366_DIBLA|nr:unnamed protein product [Dibothriocephalus latus]